MTMVRFARLRDEEGFTLIEVLVGMVILSIIMVAIAAALIVGMQTTDSTIARMNESHDVQISSAYLANDVQSAVNVSVTSGGASCASTTKLVDFTYAASAGGQTASYSCGPANGETQVTRSYGGSTAILAHFAGIAKPTVTCTPNCTSTPDRVAIAFTEASGYSYTLLGSRRTYNSNVSATSPNVSLLVLGGSSPLWVSGGCPPGQIDNPGNPNNLCTSDTDPNAGNNDNPKLTVIGNLYVNSTANGAVRLSGPKKQLKLEVLNGNFGILAGGTCQGCTSNTVSCPDPACTNPPSSYSPAYLDPLRFMSPPPQSGAGIYVHPTMLSINGNMTLPAGIHILKAGMNINGNANLNVSGSGGIMFYNEAGSISFAGGSLVNLPAYTSDPYKGVLIFQARDNTNPLSLSGGARVASCLGGIIYAPNSTAVALGTGGANLKVTAVMSQNIKVTGNTQVTIGGPC